MSETSDKELSGRVAVVTGGGRGLGREHALALAAAGADVVVNDIGSVPGSSGSSSECIANRIRDVGGRAASSTHDVSTWQGASELIEFALETFGGLDILLCNAGVFDRCVLVEMDEDRWKRLYAVHSTGPAALVARGMRYWQKRGDTRDVSVIFTSSLSPFVGFAGHAHYASAKMSVVGLARIVAFEGAQNGVRANVVLPTARTEAPGGATGLIPEPSQDPTAFDRFAPGNVSPLVVWLAGQTCQASGHVFHAYANVVSVLSVGRIFAQVTNERDGRWDVSALDAALLPSLPPPPAHSDYVYEIA